MLPLLNVSDVYTAPPRKTPTSKVQQEAMKSALHQFHKHLSSVYSFGANSFSDEFVFLSDDDINPNITVAAKLARAPQVGVLEVAETSKQFPQLLETPMQFPQPPETSVQFLQPPTQSETSKQFLQPPETTKQFPQPPETPTQFLQLPDTSVQFPQPPETPTQFPQPSDTSLRELPQNDTPNATQPSEFPITTLENNEILIPAIAPNTAPRKLGRPRGGAQPFVPPNYDHILNPDEKLRFIEQARLAHDISNLQNTKAEQVST
ncbi:hypothetical protein BDZ91DRAFT_764545 [Kalaharituber pfeilii]|nr:hypothetical protein BDZ91DRAFT_764545 [Kalaharituber pfeilii]